MGTTSGPDPTAGAVRTGEGEKSLLHYLGIALSGAMLIVVLAIGVAAVVVPKLSGAVPLTVLTSSMKPSLPPGTLIIVQPVDPTELRVGDVATYQIEPGKRGVITHRIISIASVTDGSREFTFQGDNNDAADAAIVVSEQIQGRLWYSIPLLGWVNNAVNGSGTSWIIPALAIVLFAYAVFMVASGAAAAVTSRRAGRSTTER